MRRQRPLLLIPLVAACATPEGEYPSLAIRDAERIDGSFDPVAPQPYVPPPPPAATMGRLDALASEVGSAHQAFLAQAPGVRSAVNSAGGVGTETWAQAQVAVSGLQATRSRATAALADIDRLYVDAAAEGTELARIAAVREAASAQVAEQDRTIDALVGSLPR